MAGTTLVEHVAATHPGIRTVWVDGSYRKHFVEHAASIGIDMENPVRLTVTKDFTRSPKHRAVERDVRLADALPPPDPLLLSPLNLPRSRDPLDHA
jgi:hypothetical protein